jgi:DNA-directed RNA polymerase subunit A"
MTLNTFHLAGVAEVQVTTGLPRIIEIFDAQKTIKTPMMEIYLKSDKNSIENVKALAAKIKETVFSELVSEYSIDIFEQKLIVKFNTVLLEDFEIDTKDLLKSIKTKAKGFTAEHTSDSLIFSQKGAKPEEVKELYSLKEKLKGVKVKGIKKIAQVLPVKRNEEYIILTSGTNLKDILTLEEVDASRTTSNDINEVFAVLGIEAARAAIIKEVYKVIESQGLNIDIRHIMLVADIMCANGKVKGITRFGVVSEKASVLARASFETPIKHLINAALEGEIDELTSVVENVMINQPVPLGTGLPGLITKMK